MIAWVTKLYFKYNGGKSFRCRELTVGDYYLYVKDYDYFLEKKLTESNQKPKLTARQLKKFVKILLGVEDSPETFKEYMRSKKTTDKNKKTLDDLHIFIFRMSANTGLDVMSLPLEMFRKYYKDIDIIIGKEQYDPNRNDKTLDIEGFMKATGGKNSL